VVLTLTETPDSEQAVPKCITVNRRRNNYADSAAWDRGGVRPVEVSPAGLPVVVPLPPLAYATTGKQAATTMPSART